MSSNYRVRDDFNDPITFEVGSGDRTVTIVATEDDGKKAERSVFLDFTGDKALTLYRALGDALEAAGLNPAGDVRNTRAKKAPHGDQEYKGNGQHTWEQVTGPAQFSSSTKRLRVPGGWLYQTDDGTTFVPLPKTKENQRSEEGE